MASTEQGRFLDMASTEKERFLNMSDIQKGRCTLINGQYRVGNGFRYDQYREEMVLKYGYKSREGSTTLW